MKLQFLLVFGLLSSMIFGQEISTQLPVLSPQSPTTSELGKYGEVQVNESTGIISPSIPLFDYYAGKMNLPISLSYSGNGVRVNQDPTWTGVNWSLNPGGVITRVVKDYPDELAQTNSKNYYTTSELNALPGAWQMAGGQYASSTVWYNTLYGISSTGVDSEVDIFTYNFLGYSGSFYFDKDYKVHLIKFDKELDITFSFAANNKSSFMIKTPEGDAYFFGGPTASESSKTCVIQGAGSCSDAFSLPKSQNAFYLNQISFLKGGAVYFDYTQNNSNICSYKIGIQESATISGSPSLSCSISNPRDITSIVENTVTLKKIRSTFNNQFVEFDTSEVNKCASIYKLNNVYLKSLSASGAETNIKKIKLNYLTVNKETDPTRNKFMIEKVEFFNKDNVLEHNYELNYITPQLMPKKDSFAQDELGYYNGKDSNTTLLPLTTYTFINNACYHLADREASLGYAQYGALSQIKYPTGGYSTFEYELPYKGQQQVFTSHNFSATYGAPGSGYVSSGTPVVSGGISIYSTIYLPDGGDGPLVVTTPATMSAVLNATVIGSADYHSKVSLYAIKSGTTLPILIGEYNFSSGGNNTFSVPYTYNLTPGSYTFKLSIHRYSAASRTTILASTQLQLPTSFRSVYNPGLRIKRVQSYDNNANVQTTRYYYNKLVNRYTESYVFNPNFVYVTKQGENDVYNLTTNSVINTFNNDLGKYLYEYVTVSDGGDNFENGGKEMRFYKDSNQGALEYVTFVPAGSNSLGLSYQSFVDVGTNQSYQNSILAEETLYSKALTKLKNTSYNYQGTQDAFIGNMKIYSFTTNGNMFLYYETKSYKHRLLSTVTKEYFAGVANPLETTVTRTFATNKVSLPSTIETTNSNNEIEKARIYYPSDVSTIGNLTPDDVVTIPILTSKHNLAEIIKTESFVNNELLESKQVSFKNWSGNILPSVIKTKKGSNTASSFEDRVVFDNYDFYGKPLVVSMKDGMKIQYVYNSKQQVILKIENLDSTITIDDGVNPTTPCFYQNTYPNAMVTSYSYDNDTNNLISIIDPKCNKITYTYDAYGRLLYVKDKDNNILSENKYHYKN